MTTNPTTPAPSYTVRVTIRGRDAATGVPDQLTYAMRLLPDSRDPTVYAVRGLRFARRAGLVGPLTIADIRAVGESGAVVLPICMPWRPTRMLTRRTSPLR